MSEIEIITDGGRRRRWSSSEKLRIVEETMDETASISVIARRNRVAPNLLYRWRRLMLAAVEARFGGHRALHQVEMLSDNGSPYIARDTRIFARQIGLKPCFTPVKSPQSNGISEAFVNTLKRDYVKVTPLPDAATVLGFVAGWITDYNTVHPHSALRMRSPAEFRQALNPSRAVR